ncbi:MAG: ATP-dependent Clp protease adaptor ClpS [Paracoccaceae bacterium]
MYKVILLNDDFTPREFVTEVLRVVFGMGPESAHGVMITAHQQGACVVAVYTRDVAETKSEYANDLGKEAGFPLMFTTEPED